MWGEELICCLSRNNLFAYFPSSTPFAFALHRSLLHAHPSISTTQILLHFPSSLLSHFTHPFFKKHLFSLSYIPGLLTSQPPLLNEIMYLTKLMSILHHIPLSRISKHILKHDCIISQTLSLLSKCPTGVNISVCNTCMGDGKRGKTNYIKGTLSHFFVYYTQFTCVHTSNHTCCGS